MKYWYEFFVRECVLCGRTDKYKRRVYSEKPKDHAERHHYEQYMCSCSY